MAVTAQGETLVQFRAVDGAGNTSAWAPGHAPSGDPTGGGPVASGTVRLDRTAPTAPTVTGGSLTWQSVASVTVSSAGSSDSGGSSLSGYEYRTSTDGGTTWGTAASGPLVVVSAQGETLLQFRSLDGAGNTSAWTPASATAGSTVRLDRTAPAAPTVTGGSLSWQSVASVTVTGAGSTDAGGSALSGYEYRTSTDGGTTWSTATGGASTAVTAEGETLVQLRALDGAGNTSAWTPASATAGSTVRLDRTAPTAPTVTGGSLTWQNVASLTITGAGSTDAGGSSLAGYEHRTSTDGGTTWSAAGAGATATVTAEGETLVQFRSLDGAGNTGAWTPASATAGSTARIDRTGTTPPAVAGGSLSWQSVASITITGSGATGGSSGLAGYEHRSSTDGGTTWSAPASGASVTVTSEGETLVQFRSLDNAGGASAWTPASATAGSTARIDRTTPTAPTVTGGSLSWQSVASVTVTGAGSTDSGGSAVSGYEYRTSTDGGTTWDTPTAGASTAITAQGETLVQFRSVDGAGNASAWTPASATAGSTVRLDRTAPAAPTVSGGSLSWQSVASVTVTATGSTDSGGSSLSGYEYRTSTDDGTTWSAPASGASLSVTAQGETLVQFRAVDTAGNTSAWTPAHSPSGGIGGGGPVASGTVRLDRAAPTAPTVSGGSLTWQSVVSITLTGAGSTDSGGSALSGYEYRTSTDGGSTWSSAAAGASYVATAEGETLAQFRSVDGAGNAGAWTPASAAAGSTARIDRTAPTGIGIGGGSSLWSNAPSITIAAAGTTTDALSGVAGFEHRTSTDGGTTWSAAAGGASLAVTAEGETDVQVRAIDNAGNAQAWYPVSRIAAARVRLDHTDPTTPAVTGGSASWQNVASVTLTASGSTDAGGSGLDVYEYRTSTDGGATWVENGDTGASLTITDEGETLVQYRAGDLAGNVSAWSASGIARIDRTDPTAPTVTGGSLSWQSVASVTVTGAGSTDSGGSALTGYEHRTSTDGGTTWSTATSGASAAVTAEGETLVQFRSVDNAGNTSAWTPGSGTAGSTVRLDRTTPTAPTVNGGSLSWQSVASVTVTAAGSTDSGGSSLSGYESRTSTDGGTTWGTATPGASAAITAQGETLVQFRSVDGAGNASAWTPASATAGSTVRIDRTDPTAPTVAGGSVGWQSVASVTVTGAGSTDSGGSTLTGYEHRTSTDGGTTWGTPTSGASAAITAQGETLVQVRSLDGAGNTSAWTPGSATAGSTVRIDRTDPTAPTVTGGSLSWQSVASVTVTGAGSTDSGGSTLTGYEHRTSTDGGTTWGTAASGASAVITAEGETLVQFRSLDGAGNTTAWTPGSATAGSTVRIDRTDPTAPTVTGGSLSWQSVASVTVTGAGSTDSGGSTLTGYEHRTSTDGGTTWGTATSGGSVAIAAAGETLVQFRSVDGAGNTSAWTPASATAGATVRIDRTAPTDAHR